MEYFDLNDGRRMPKIGLGTFQGTYDYNSTETVVVNAVKSSVSLGYRHIDTAFMYNTEKPIGIAVNELINSKQVARDDIFITTKLWNHAHRRQDVVPALKESLANLQLDYVDMFLVHWPIAFQQGSNPWPKDDKNQTIYDDALSFTETWDGMIECQKLGLAKSIGVSNFNRRQLKVLFEHSSIKPANQQIEVNPYFGNEVLVDFCKQHGVQVTCYSPLGKPARPWKKEEDPVVATDPVLTSVGEKYGKTPSQVALRFLTQRGLAVIPKCNSVDHQKENVSIFDFKLSDEEMKEVWKCNRNMRILSLRELLGGSKEYPFDED